MLKLVLTSIKENKQTIENSSNSYFILKEITDDYVEKPVGNMKCSVYTERYSLKK